MEVIVVVVVHSLEQARLAMWRRVVALPRSSNPDLCVFLPRTAAATVMVMVMVMTTLTPGSPRHPAIAHIPRVLKPVTRVVLLPLLNLERALLHPHPVLVSRTLANVYRRARTPAVAEGVTIFPGWRGACADGSSGSI